MWTKFKLPFKWIYLGVAVFALVGGFSIASKPTETTLIPSIEDIVSGALIFATSIFAIIAVILLIVNARYNIRINLETKQIKRRGKVYNFTDVTKVRTIVHPGANGVPQVDLVLIFNDGKKGKIPTSLPFFPALKEETFNVLFKAFPQFTSLPEKPDPTVLVPEIADRRSVMTLLRAIRKAYYLKEQPRSETTS